MPVDKAMTIFWRFTQQLTHNLPPYFIPRVGGGRNRRVCFHQLPILQKLLIVEEMDPWADSVRAPDPSFGHPRSQSRQAHPEPSCSVSRSKGQWQEGMFLQGVSEILCLGP